MNNSRSLDDRVELIVRRTKENDETASRSRIMNAYRVAAELHEGVFRKDGVTPYIDHPVSVAEIVAGNGGDQTMVIAALLHDTVEDTEYTLQQLSVSFGKDVADIVDALTNVDENIPDDITDSHQRRLIKNYLDGLSNAKLLDPENPQAGKAVYIKLADRLHNMLTIEACSPKSQTKKAADTLQFFVPLARLINSRYFERELSELCFRVLQPDLYREIESAYEETRTRNSRHIASFMQMFDFTLREFGDSTCPQLFRKVSSNSLKCYQIRDLLGSNGWPYSSMGSFTKSSIYLYEVLLSYNGHESPKMLQSFIDLYMAELRPKGVSLELLPDYPSETAAALILTDGLSNRYLVLLRLADSALLSSDYTSLFPPNSSVTEMPDRLITVYSRDGKPYQMAEGSTVLDFAFRIHPDLGCSAQYALVRRGNSEFEILPDQSPHKRVRRTQSDTECEINHPLQDGDHVFVVGDSDPHGEPIYHVDYEWFGYVKTQYAIDHLVEFYHKAVPNPDVRTARISWDPKLSEKFRQKKSG